MFGAAARACNIYGTKVSVGSVCGRWVLVTTILASSMAFLDDTVVTLALPTIERELDTGLSGLQWILNGYLLILGALILLGGRFGDVFGRRRILVSGLAIFAAASAVAAGAPTIEFLVGARVVQGAGAALMIPSSLALITASFQGEDQGQAIGVWSAMTALSVALGPLVGGWLVDAASWRWVFLINLPLAAVAILAALRYVPESSDPDERGHLDLSGAGLAVVALAGLTVAPVQGPALGWGHPIVVGGLGAGFVALAIFLLLERHKSHAMLPLHFFRVRQFSGANLATFGLYASIDALFFLSVIQLQSQVGFSALMAGMSLIPVTVLLVLLSPPMGKLAGRIGARLPMTIGPLVMAAGLLLIAQITPGRVEPTFQGYATTVLPSFTLFGLGLAITVAPLTTAALTALDDTHAGLASGVNTAVARVAGLAGIALLPLVAGISGGGSIGSGEFSEGFQRAMWICAGLTSISAAFAFLTVAGQVGLVLRRPNRRRGRPST
ncbi:MAG: MFS transporter [Thermoleophilia bacterium]